MAYGVVGFVALLLGMYAAFQVRTWRTQRVQAEDKYYFTCPKCRRKFGYRARQAGHKGACPRCGQNLIFPSVQTLSASGRQARSVN